MLGEGTPPITLSDWTPAPTPSSLPDALVVSLDLPPPAHARAVSKLPSPPRHDVGGGDDGGEGEVDGAAPGKQRPPPAALVHDPSQSVERSSGSRHVPHLKLTLAVRMF